jgi:hypothetical protein
MTLRLVYHRRMNPKPSFGSYYLGTLLRPRRTFDKLMTDPRRLKFGALAVAISAALYTLVYVFLTIGGGAPSSFKPFLAIPVDLYYSYDRFIVAPSMFGCWILAAGVAQLLSHRFSGEGTFEDVLSAFGFAIAISLLISMLHDLPETFLGAIGLLDFRWYEVALNSPTVWRVILWIFYGGSILVFLILFPKAVGAARRLRRGPGILIGVIAYLVYQGVFIIFNR